MGDGVCGRVGGGSGGTARELLSRQIQQGGVPGARGYGQTEDSSTTGRGCTSSPLTASSCNTFECEDDDFSQKVINAVEFSNESW